MDTKTKIQIIKTEIDKCSIFEYQEIYNIIKKNNANFSKNINGIFVDLQRLEPSIIDLIYNYIIYCGKLTQNINEYENIKNNIIKNNLHNIDDHEEIKIDNIEQIIEQVESEEDTSVLPIIKNKVSSTMKFYILKKKLTIKNTIFNNQIDNNLDYDTPYKT
jgi:hypothetical protein|tara:strand:+ start:955 stop:1437 length:483 start_codon:yes stop_codon:yes gene_type:complete